MDLVLLGGVLAAGVRLAMALGFAAVGEAVSERAGVINVGIEGIMLMGAWMGVFGAVVTGSPWGGVALAFAGGLALGAIHGYFCITLRADQIVAGIAMVIVCLGVSGFLNRLTREKVATTLPVFAPADLGPLADLPVIGGMLFRQNLLVYVGVALAIGLAWAMRRTVLGLEVRACGEDPEATDAAGVPVIARRYLCVIVGGGLAAVGGAYLAIVQVGAFVENMVSGRGFIAIACVVFGRWHPVGVLGAALGFGLAESLQIRLQTWYPNVPYQFFVMLPYLAAIVALVFLARGAAMPRALGQPFRSAHR